MHYQLSRNGQTYGPYTFEDLQRYLASGNVQPSDLVKSAEMAEWITVAQLLAATPAPPVPDQPPVPTQALVDPNAPVGFPRPDPAAVVNRYPDPPNLNWGLVLLFDVFTCGFFQVIWNIVIAVWTRRVQTNSTALFYYIASDLLYVCYGCMGAGTGLHAYISMTQNGTFYESGHHMLLRGLLALAAWIVKLIARFQLRESLLQHFNGPEPIGLRLSGVMTFFFGGLYFQYHLSRIHDIKTAARFGTLRY